MREVTRRHWLAVLCGVPIVIRMLPRRWNRAGNGGILTIREYITKHEAAWAGGLDGETWRSVFCRMLLYYNMPPRKVAELSIWAVRFLLREGRRRDD